MIQEFFPVLEGVPMGDLWVLLTWGMAIAVPYTFLLWLWLRRAPREDAGNFSLSSATALLGLFYAVKSDGYGPRRFLMGALVLLWVISLSRRFWTGGSSESETEAPLIPTFLSFMGRAFLAVLLSVPFALLSTDPLQKMTLYEWLGLILWALGIAGPWLDESRQSLFDWLIWVAFFVAALATPYGAWTILCPLILLYFLKPFSS